MSPMYNVTDFLDHYEPTTLTPNVQRAIVTGVLVGDNFFTNWVAPWILLFREPFALVSVPSSEHVHGC